MQKSRSILPEIFKPLCEDVCGSLWFRCKCGLLLQLYEISYQLSEKSILANATEPR